MIEVGSVSIFIPIKKLSKLELEDYSISLFDSWENDLNNILAIPDYSIILEVEDGSIGIKGKIAAGAIALYTGVAQYGSFISGVEIISKQASVAINSLASKATKNHTTKENPPTIRKSGGDLVRIRNLVHKVQQGKISVEYAVREIEKILEKSQESSSLLMREIESSLNNSPIYPEQGKFDFGFGAPLEIVKEPKSINNSPLNRVPVNLPNHYQDRFRIELWRESKRGEKNLRIIKVN